MGHSASFSKCKLVRCDLYAFGFGVTVFYILHEGQYGVFGSVAGLTIFPVDKPYIGVVQAHRPDHLLNNRKSVLNCVVRVAE